MKMTKLVLIGAVFLSGCAHLGTSKPADGTRGIYIRGDIDSLQWKTGSLIHADRDTGTFGADNDTDNLAVVIPLRDFYPAVQEFQGFHPGDLVVYTNMNNPDETREIRIREVYSCGLADIGGLVRVKELAHSGAASMQVSRQRVTRRSWQNQENTTQASLKITLMGNPDPVVSTLTGRYGNVFVDVNSLLSDAIQKLPDTAAIADISYTGFSPIKMNFAAGNPSFRSCDITEILKHALVLPGATKAQLAAIQFNVDRSTSCPATTPRIQPVVPVEKVKLDIGKDEVSLVSATCGLDTCQIELNFSVKGPENPPDSESIPAEFEGKITLFDDQGVLGTIDHIESAVVNWGEGEGGVHYLAELKGSVSKTVLARSVQNHNGSYIAFAAIGENPVLASVLDLEGDHGSQKNVLSGRLTKGGPEVARLYSVTYPEGVSLIFSFGSEHRCIENCEM